MFLSTMIISLTANGTLFGAYVSIMTCFLE